MPHALLSHADTGVATLQWRGQAGQAAAPAQQGASPSAGSACLSVQHLSTAKFSGMLQLRGTQALLLLQPVEVDDTAALQPGNPHQRQQHQQGQQSSSGAVSMPTSAAQALHLPAASPAATATSDRELQPWEAQLFNLCFGLPPLQPSAHPSHPQEQQQRGQEQQYSAAHGQASLTVDQQYMLLAAASGARLVRMQRALYRALVQEQGEEPELQQGCFLAGGCRHAWWGGCLWRVVVRM
jgi:hypothetical protein